VKKTKTKEEIQLEKLQEELKSPKWYVRWWARFRTREFQKKMTWYYVGSYSVFLFLGWKYMQGLYKKDQELDDITGKLAKEGHLNEYEILRWKKLTGKSRHRDEKKLEEYERLKQEGVTDFEDVVIEVKGLNVSNEKILPPRDTTDFYDSKAEEYDSEIDWEEKMVFMGKRRKWLMKHCRGDVLEVSCGTGRNIKYMAMDQIKSVTFLDSSKKMMEIANKKFREKFPTYKNAAFVVGRAEDLVELARGQEADISVSDVDDERVFVNEQNAGIKYDTIIEAFGLCSHEDPVKALMNFATLLKPGGRIVLLEHGRGEYDLINDVLDNRAEKRLETWGCRWNLDIGEILDDSGLEITEEKRTHLGTTWCIVAKKKEDLKRKEEMSFVEKYISPGIQRKLEQMREQDEKVLTTEESK
jgi:methyltransferase OMS1